MLHIYFDIGGKTLVEASASQCTVAENGGRVVPFG